MGLLVWLPLNGDVENKGASLTTIINNSAVVDNAGKIGKCYSFNGNNYYISLAGQQLFNCFKGGSTPFSICMWVYHGDSRRAILFGDWSTANSIGFNIELSTAHAVRFYWSGNPDYWPGEMIVGANTWSHITITYDGSTITSYLNGVKKATRSVTLAALNKTAGEFRLGRDNRTTDTALNGKLNDVRIYDHCLSAAEVHEISQGLVLHYKLDSPYDLASSIQNKYNSPYSDGQCSGSSFTRTQLTNERGYNYKTTFTGTGTNTWYNWYVPAYSFTAGKRYYYSVKIRCNKWTVGTLTLRAARSNNDYGGCDAVTICSNGLADGQWHEYVVSEIVNETYVRSGSTVTCNPRMEFYTANMNGNGTIYDMDFDVKDVQVVESNSYISFIDNALATSTITDSSGYGHSGTITGNVSLTTNTARYSTAAVFSGYQNPTIDAANPSFLSAMTNCTVTWWEYVTVTGNNLPIRGQDGSHYIGAGSTSTNLYHYNAGDSGVLYINGVAKTSTVASPKVTSSYKYEQNKWVHFAFTNANLSSWTKFQLNNYSSNWPVNGYISDVRVYATALSAADVKSLYEVGARVDNKHGIHSYEFIETGANKVTKQGQLKGSNIHEIPDLFAYDPILYIEPDGTQWAHIFHHNNPASYKFASTDTFNSFVYTDINRWFNFAACNLLDKWELFAAVSKTSGATVTKYRWIQTVSPMTATFDQTKVANVTRITTTGYTQCSFGGLYHVSSSSWLAMNNGTNNNWFGATGCWTVWNNGIPGWASTSSSDAITSGCIDIYIRVDNIDFNKINLTAKSIKTNKWQGNHLIEF